MEIISKESIFGDVIFYSQERHEEDLVGVYPEITKPLMQEFGYRIVRGSAAGWNGEMHEKRLRKFFEDKEIHHAVEIGTWRGVSSAILAHYADKVTTVDIRYYDEAPRVWLWAGLHKKINYLVVPDNETKAAVLAERDFDFAFIDGMHTYEDVALDFDIVKKCGRVLFHDYSDRCPGIVAFVDTLANITIDKPFAYWEEHGNH